MNTTLVRRSLDWKVLLGTILVGGVIGLGLHLLHHWQLGRTSKGLLVLADAQEKESSWNKAAEYLDRYLRLRPAATDVRIRLAQTYARGADSYGEKQRAVELYYKALAKGDKEHELELHRGLAQLLVDTGRFAEAETQAQRVLQTAPDDPQANRALALALTSQLQDGSLAAKKTEKLKLVTTVEKARKINGGDVQLAKTLAALYREFPQTIQAENPRMTESERHARADESLNQLVLDNPQSASAYLARHIYRKHYKLPDAQADLDAALRLAPDDHDVLLTAGFNSLYQAREKGRGIAAVHALLEQSKGYFEKLTAQDDEPPLPQSLLGLGDACLGLGEVEKALSTWREGLKQFARPTTLVLFQASIADTCIDRDRLSEAGAALDAIDQILAKLAANVSRDEKLELTRSQDLRRATWHVKRRDLAAAVPLLRQVVVTHPKGDANTQSALRAYSMLGSIYSALGEWQEAAAVFDQVSSLQPNLPQIRVAASTAWLSAGRADLANERAEQALKIAEQAEQEDKIVETAEAWSALAAAQLQQQTRLPPQDRTWNRLERSLTELEKSRDKSSHVAPWRIDFLRADYLVAKAQGANEPQRGASEAIKLLQAAEGNYANQKEFWRQVCFAYEALKSASDADRAVVEFRKSGATAAEVAVSEARLASLRGEYARAKAVINDARKTAPAQDQEQLLAELLHAAYTAKDWSLAGPMLEEDHRRQPQNLNIVRRLGEIYLQQRNLIGLEGLERDLQSAGGIGEPLAHFFRAWRYYLSALENTDSRLVEALRELDQVMLMRPNWAEPAALKAMTEQRLGRHTDAVANYERAVNLGDRRVLVFEQLITLLDHLQRPAEVERYLARLEADIPLSSRLADFLATDQEIREQRPEQAVGIALKNVAQRPRDPEAQLWLGRLLMILGQKPEAEQALRKAAELAPANPRMWNGLLAFYARTGSTEQIQRALDDLEKNAKLDEDQKNLLLGQAQEMLGNIDAAKRSFEKAASQANSVAAQLRVAQFYMQSDLTQAKIHLETALRIDPKSEIAKRLLAIVHASLGDLPQAESLLSETSGDKVIATQDVRLHVVLLIQQGGAANLQRAVELLDGIVNRGSANEPVQPVDHLLLARLYEQQAQMNDDASETKKRLDLALRQLTLLCERSAPQPAHLAALIQFLIRHPKFGEAAPWLKTLEERVDALAKVDPNALTLVIEMQIALGPAEQSEKWIQKLEKVDLQPLRPLALKVRAAVRRDALVDVEALIEPKAASLLANAKTPEEKQQLYGGVGDLYVTVKKDAAAERWYRLLMAVDASKFPVVVGALTRQGRLKEAIDICEQMAQTDATVQPALTLATALVGASPTELDFRRAEPILAAALKKFDSDLRLLYAVSLVRVIQGKEADAVSLFRNVVKVNPRFVPALNNLAMMLAERPADRAEALQLIDRAIEIAGKDPGLLDTKGTILVYSGQTREAMPVLELATRGSKVDPRHNFHLALAYRDQGKTEEAKAQLKTALNGNLGSLILTPTDRKLLSDLRAAFQL